MPGAHVGELNYTVIKRQFEALRDGDRFWYERTLSPEELRQVRGTRLADVIRNNTSIGDEIGDNVFRAGGCAVVSPVPGAPTPSLLALIVPGLLLSVRRR